MFLLLVVKSAFQFLLVISSFGILYSSEFVVAVEPGLPFTKTPSYRNCRVVSRDILFVDLAGHEITVSSVQGYN